MAEENAQQSSENTQQQGSVHDSVETNRQDGEHVHDETQGDGKSGKRAQDVHAESETSGDEVETRTAISLYRALSDPKQAKIVLTSLAAQAGLTFKQDDTREEKQEKVSSLRDIIKEELGDEYQFLAGKLGNVLERTLESERKMSSAKLAELEAKAAEREAEEAFSWLKKEFDDADEYMGEIVSLVERTPIGRGVSAKEHLEELYVIAKHRTAKERQAKTLAKKIQRNSSDPDTKLNGKRPQERSGVLARPAQTLEEALEQAAASLK